VLFNVGVPQKSLVADEDPAAAVSQGSLSVEFYPSALRRLGWEFTARGSKEGEIAGDRLSFPVLSSSTLRAEPTKDGTDRTVVGSFRTHGALLLTGVGDRVVIGNFMINADVDGSWTVLNTLNDFDEPREVFRLTDVNADPVTPDGRFRMAGNLSPVKTFADALGFPETEDLIIGVVSIDVELGALGMSLHADATDHDLVDEESQGDHQLRIGPDVVVGDLFEVLRFGRIGDITAYAVGTNSCNYGDENATWVSFTNQHPVISQSMFRLKEGRFEQIGLSWVKHGFYAVSNDFCNLGCPEPTDGSELGVGCSDPYSAYLNGVRGNMSLRSDVNAHTGYFPYPWTAPDPQTLIDKRLQVHDADLDPDLNEGAVYFVQGHYVTPDDAAWGNSDNNASYRRVNVIEAQPGSNFFTVAITSTTQRGESAIRAWQDSDGDVHEMDIPVPDEGLFILSAKVTELGAGVWHYEFALQNLNSDQSARSFTYELPDGAVLANVGFHDVDYHSGEIYDLTDWDYTIDADSITWSTDTYDVNPNANALRFGTIYNFRFDANFDPRGSDVTVGLFKPGDTTEVTAHLVIGCAPAPPVGHTLTPDLGSGTKNRYLSFGLVPHASETLHAVQVTFASLPGYEYAEGRTMWVQQPTEVTESSGTADPGPPPTLWTAGLGCNPYWGDWSLYDMVHVYDGAIIPGGTYEVRTITEACDLADPTDYSVMLPVQLSAIGDIVGDCGVQPCTSPNGVIDFVDISATVEKFKNQPTAPTKARTDVVGGNITDPIPDRKVDFVDISYVVEAFRSVAPPPPGPPASDPCAR
jgi:hypothetical protein